ncbi:MAG: hypothetical protein ACLGI2_06705 [Acidimicrobiia bacterium]
MKEQDRTLSAVHPGWRDRLATLLADGPYGLTSVWRSSRLQKIFFECAQSGCQPRRDGRACHGVPGDCPGANPPGTSNHEYEEEGVPASLAVDLFDRRGDGFARAHELGPSLGLHFPIASEPWHVQPREVRASTLPARSPFEPVASLTFFDQLFLFTAPREQGANVNRFPARERAKGHEGHLTYDLFHVFPDGHVRDGVRYDSQILIYVAEPGEAAEIEVFLPRTRGVARRTISFGEEHNERPREFGMASVVSRNDVPLVVFHEVTVGKP